MASQYPAQIDTVITLPLVVDGVTPFNSTIVNNLRNAIVFIEQTLGVNPASIYGTVRARLDAIEASIAAISGQEIHLSGDLGGTLANPRVVGIQGSPVANIPPLPGQTLIWTNAGFWAPEFPDLTQQSYTITLSGPSTFVEIGENLINPIFTATYNEQPVAATLTDNVGNPLLNLVLPYVFNVAHGSAIVIGTGSTEIRDLLVNNDIYFLSQPNVSYTIASITPSGTFNVQNGHTSVAASISQTGQLFNGCTIYFASQPTVPYTILTVSGTAVVLTSNYTGPTNTTTTIIFSSVFILSTPYSGPTSLSTPALVPNSFIYKNIYGPTDSNNDFGTYGSSIIFTLISTALGVIPITVSESFTITATQKIYFGAAPAGGNTASFIQSLPNSPLSDTKRCIFTVGAGNNQSIYFAYRSAYGLADFWVDGWEGGFNLISTTIPVTNSNGFTENYTLYQSAQTNLGITTVNVF